MNGFRSQGIRVVELGSVVKGEGKYGWGIKDISSKKDLEFRFSITLAPILVAM